MTRARGRSGPKQHGQAPASPPPSQPAGPAVPGNENDSKPHSRLLTPSCPPVTAAARLPDSSPAQTRLFWMSGAMARSAKGWWCRLCQGIGASMRRRTGPQIETERSGVRVHVLTADCADADRMVDRRGRRACLLKGLPHEEIAPRCVRRRLAR